MKHPSPVCGVLALVGLVAVHDLPGDAAVGQLGQRDPEQLLQSSVRQRSLSVVRGQRCRVLDGDRAVHRGLHGLEGHRRGVDLHAHRRLEDVETHDRLFVDDDLRVGDVLLGRELDHRGRGGVRGERGVVGQRRLSEPHLRQVGAYERVGHLLRCRCRGKRRPAPFVGSLDVDGLSVLVVDLGLGHWRSPSTAVDRWFDPTRPKLRADQRPTQPIFSGTPAVKAGRRGSLDGRRRPSPSGRGRSQVREPARPEGRLRTSAPRWLAWRCTVVVPWREGRPVA